MITFSNLRADEAAIVTVPLRAGASALRALVDAGRDLASARWEHELVAWLADRRAAITGGLRAGLDLGEIAWTPERFPDQQRFVLAICDRAIAGAPTDAERAALTTLRELVERHGRELVPVGRRWRWLIRRPDPLDKTQ